MLRLILIFFISSSISLVAKSQDEINGKWYFFSRNRMIEVNFLHAKTVSKQLDWNFSNWDNDDSPGTQPISKQVFVNKNIYIYSLDTKDSLKRLRVETYRVVKAQEEMILVVNSPDSLFSDQSKIAEYIRTDTGPKYGIPLFSESEIKRFQKLKDIDSMSVPDFKLYVSKMQETGKMSDSLDKMGASINAVIYYGYAMMRSNFVYLGYNPLVTSDKLNSWFKSLEKNPTMKAELKKLGE